MSIFDILRGRSSSGNPENRPSMPFPNRESKMEEKGGAKPLSPQELGKIWDRGTGGSAQKAGGMPMNNQEKLPPEKKHPFDMGWGISARDMRNQTNQLLNRKKLELNDTRKFNFLKQKAGELAKKDFYKKDVALKIKQWKHDEMYKHMGTLEKKQLLAEKELYRDLGLLPKDYKINK